MSRQLNPSGIGYANLVLLAGVDDDNATVRDFANLSNTLTADSPSNQAVLSGAYGHGFTVASEDSYHVYGYSMSAGPTINAGAGNSVTMFVAFNELSAQANGAVPLIVAASGNWPTVGFQSGGNTTSPSLLVGLQNRLASTFSLGTAAAHSVAITFTYAGAQAVYVDGALVASSTDSSGASVGCLLDYIGGYQGQGTIGASICYLAYFNTALTATQIQGLHNSLTGNNAFSLIQAPVGAALAATPADSSAAAGTLNSDLLGAASDVSSATGSLYAFPSAVASDVSQGSGALTTAILMAAGAASVTNGAAALTNWATVTLTAPLYTGVGSILDPNATWSAGAPAIGDTVYYDGTYLTIEPDGEILGTINGFSALAQWDNAGAWSSLTIIGTPGLAAYGSTAGSAVGALATAIQLLGAANALTTAAGALSTQLQLAGAAQALSSAAGQLSTAIRAAGAALDDTVASGAFAGTQQALSAAASDTDSASAVLNTQIAMLAAAVSLTSAAGALATQIVLGANALSVTSAIGSLGTEIQASGNAASRSAASGSILTGINLSAPVSDFAQAAGQLLTEIVLLGALSDATQAGAALSTGSLLSGAAVSIASAVAALSTLIKLAGQAQSGSAASGALTTGVQLSGAAQDGSTAAGTIPQTPSLAGGAVSVAEAAATLSAPPRFGWMNVIAQGQAGFAGGEATYLAGSVCTVTAEYFDLDGNPFEPESVQYRIDDVLSGENILPWTNLAAATSNLVVITAVQNAMINATRLNEQHQVIFAVTDGYGSEPYLGRVIFNVQSAAGLN